MKNVHWIFLLLMAGCAPALYVPDPRDATPEASLQELVKGREIYTERCARCHSLYLPDRFSTAQWKAALDRMQPRARIDSTEKELILKMIFAGKARSTRED